MSRSLDYSLELRFKDVISEDNTWSQCVILEVDESNVALQKLNKSVMKRLDMEPGFQAPCRKAHLSLLYGNLLEESKEEARAIVRRDFGKGIFGNSFPMKTVELWKTGGGLEGISKWSHVAFVCL